MGGKEYIDVKYNQYKTVVHTVYIYCQSQKAVNTRWKVASVVYLYRGGGNNVDILLVSIFQFEIAR